MMKYELLFAVVSACIYLITATACTLEYDPVCGADGKTYSNSCFLSLKMKTEPKLALLYKGVCHTNDRKPRSLPPCSSEVKEVCGTDEVTYKNICELKRSFNTINKVMLLHIGPCSQKTIEKLVNKTDSIKENHDKLEKELNKKKSESYNKINIKDNHNNTASTTEKPIATNATQNTTKKPIPEVQLSCPCGREFEDICGAGGVAHDHPCLLKCVAKFHSTLQMEFEGICNGSDLIAHVKKPAVGNNTKTHANRTQDDDKKQLSSKNYSLSDNSSNVTNNEHEIRRYPCRCHTSLREVCGTDGVTYGNPCQLRCATANNTEIQLKHKGACNETDFNVQIDNRINVTMSARNNNGIHINTWNNGDLKKSCDCDDYHKLVTDDDENYSTECESDCALFVYANTGLISKHLVKRSIQARYGGGRNYVTLRFG